MTTIGPNRPQRQRKSVCHYSDDNPNTFTVKVKRGDENVEIESKSPLDTSQSSGRRGIKRPRSYSRSKHAVNYPKHPKQQEDVDDDDDDDVIIESLAAPAVAVPPPRRGRPPRRASIETRASSSSSSSRSSSPHGTISSTAPRTKMTTKLAAQKKATPNATTQVRRKKRVRILVSSTASISELKLPQDEILSHAAAIQTVLPLEYQALSNRRAESYEDFLGDIIVPSPMPLEWVHLDLNDDAALRLKAAPKATSYSRTKAPILHSNQVPFDVTATTVKPAVSVTAFASRQLPRSFRRRRPSKSPTESFHCNDENTNGISEWIVTGDCVGVVFLWKSGCSRQLCRLRTAASFREERRVISSKKVISYPNAIQQTGWSLRDIVLVLTETDLEGIQIKSPCCRQQNPTTKHDEIQRRLFLVDVSESIARSMPQSQQFHFDFEDPIVLWSTDERRIGGKLGAAKTETTSIASLLCLDLGTTTSNSVKSLSVVPDGEDTFRCIVAIWDAFGKVESGSYCRSGKNILSVAQTAADTLELLRLTLVTGDEKTFVVDRSIVPLVVGRGLNLNQVDCTLQQIPMSNYKFTLLCGTRTGILLLDSESLACLATFGKSVSLHGKQVQWNFCHWIPCPRAADASDLIHESVGKNKQSQRWLERRDELAVRTGGLPYERGMRQKVAQTVDSSAGESRFVHATLEVGDGGDDTSGKNEADNQSFWLLGVPHPRKGPSELKSTVYIWKNPLIGIALDKDVVMDPFIQQQQLLIQQHADSNHLRLPPGGCIGLSIVPRQYDLELFCANAASGQLYLKKAALRTNFPGVMYPVGYFVIDNNIEYIEDEDEMDQPIIIEEVKDDIVEIGSTAAPKPRGRPRKNPLPPPPAASNDDDLTEALRLSLLEMKKAQVAVSETCNASDEIVEILDLSNHDDETFKFIVPSWPDQVLLRRCNDPKMLINEDTIDDVYTENFDSRQASESFILENFPHYLHVQQCWKQQRSAVHDLLRQDSQTGMASVSSSDIQSTCSTSTCTGNNNSNCTNNNVSKALKGKRNKMVTGDVMLQSSMDANLRLLMSKERGKWSNGGFALIRQNSHLFPKHTSVRNLAECHGLDGNSFSEESGAPDLSTSFVRGDEKWNANKLSVGKDLPSLDRAASSQLEKCARENRETESVGPKLILAGGMPGEATNGNGAGTHMVHPGHAGWLDKPKTADLTTGIGKDSENDSNSPDVENVTVSQSVGNFDSDEMHQGVSARMALGANHNESEHDGKSEFATIHAQSERLPRGTADVADGRAKLEASSVSTPSISAAGLVDSRRDAPMDADASLDCFLAKVQDGGSSTNCVQGIATELGANHVISDCRNVNSGPSGASKKLVPSENWTSLVTSSEIISPGDDDAISGIETGAPVAQQNSSGCLPGEHTKYSIHQPSEHNRELMDRVSATSSEGVTSSKIDVSSTGTKEMSVSTNGKSVGVVLVNEGGLSSSFFMNSSDHQQLPLNCNPSQPEDQNQNGQLLVANNQHIGMPRPSDFSIPHVDGNCIVTPSESSPGVNEAHHPSLKNDVPNGRAVKVAVDEDERKSECAACRGRPVVHICGRREKPVDYEAIARAERENKERLAAEKALARAEKRRQADARRREAKKLKKIEDEERKKREEEEIKQIEEEMCRRIEKERRETMERERRLRLDEEKRLHDQETGVMQFEQIGDPSDKANGFDTSKAEWGTNETSDHRAFASNTDYAIPMYQTSVDERVPEVFPYSKKVPSYRTINELSSHTYDGNVPAPLDNTSIYNKRSSPQNMTMANSWHHLDESSSRSSYQVQSLDVSHRASITIGGNTVQPSAALDPSDALAALAGLADSMPIATSESVDAYERQHGAGAEDAKALSNRTYAPESIDYSYRERAASGNPYEYSGSLERQAAIHRALADSGVAESTQQYGSSSVAGDSASYPVYYDAVSQNPIRSAEYPGSQEEALEAPCYRSQGDESTTLPTFAYNDASNIGEACSSDEAEYDAIIGSANRVNSNWGHVGSYHTGWDREELQSQHNVRSTSSVGPVTSGEHQARTL